MVHLNRIKSCNIQLLVKTNGLFFKREQKYGFRSLKRFRFLSLADLFRY